VCVCVSSLVSTHWSVIWVAYGEGTHPLHKHLPALWPQCFVVVAALSITIIQDSKEWFSTSLNTVLTSVWDREEYGMNILHREETQIA